MEVPLALQDLDLRMLRTTKGKVGHKGITFHNLNLNGRPLRFLLLPMGQAAKIPWKPSAFQGNGQEQRVNVVFEISEKQREMMEEIEDIVRTQFSFKGTWNSALKSKDGGWLLKAKLNLSSAKKTVISGVEELPEVWPRFANASIRIHTVYHQKNAMGLILETEALDFMPEPAHESPFKSAVG